MTGQAPVDPAQTLPDPDPGYPRLALPSRPAFVAGAGVAVLLVGAYVAAGALLVFVIGAVIAVILDPVVTWLTRRGVPRVVATAVVVLALTILTAMIGLLIALTIASEAFEFVGRIPGWLHAADGWYRTAPLPTALRDVTDQLIAEVRDSVPLSDLLARAVEWAGGLGVTVAVLFGVLPFFLFFALADRPRTVARLVTAIPRSWRGDVVTIGGIILRAFATYLRGEALLAGMLMALTWLGLQLLASSVDPRLGEFAGLLTLIAGASELVPLVGPWLAAVPAVAVALTIGPEAALATAAVYLVIAIVEGQILVPLVHGRRFSLHPIVVGLGIVVGHAAFGAIGAVLALPVLAGGLESYRYVFRRSTGALSAPTVWIDPSADDTALVQPAATPPVQAGSLQVG